MSKVIPFCGMRYNTEKVHDLSLVTAPPFEIQSAEEERKLFEKSEYNINRISSQFKNKVDSPVSVDPCDAIMHWKEQGVFVEEREPALYIYEQAFVKALTPRSVKGVFGLVEVEDYGNKIIFPNEEISSTVNGKIYDFWDRSHINICRIWSFYSDDDARAEAMLVNICEKVSPDAEFSAGDGIVHRLWIVHDKEFIDGFCGLLEDKPLFIAEGHHKYETALKFRDEYRKRYPGYGSDAPFNYTMMLMMPMEQNSLEIMPIHRLVNSEIFDENTLINNLTMDFAISKIYITDDSYSETIMTKLSVHRNEKVMGLYTGGNYYYFLRLSDKADMSRCAEGKSECFRQLDVTVLNSLILEKQLTRTVGSCSIKPKVAYTRSAEDAVARVKTEEYKCAVFLNPTKLSELKEISLANERLPRHSAYFMPKPLTGLVMNDMKI